MTAQGHTYPEWEDESLWFFFHCFHEGNNYLTSIVKSERNASNPSADVYYIFKSPEPLATLLHESFWVSRVSLASYTVAIRKHKDHACCYSNLPIWTQSVRMGGGQTVLYSLKYPTYKGHSFNLCMRQHIRKGGRQTISELRESSLRRRRLGGRIF